MCWVEISCAFQRCLVEMAKVGGIQNMQAERILMEKLKTTREDLREVTKEILIRKQGTKGRGSDMIAWKRQLGEILSW